MKYTLPITLGLLLFIGFFYSCSKDPGPGGNAHIHGKVYYNGQAISNAIVYIWYGATVKPIKEGDNSTVTDASGQYNFADMRKGDYYVWTSVMIADSLREGGAYVKVNQKSGNFETDIILK